MRIELHAVRKQLRMCLAARMRARVQGQKTIVLRLGANEYCDPSNACEHSKLSKLSLFSWLN
eukprot:1084065-Amphidinium_carterae.1